MNGWDAGIARARIHRPWLLLPFLQLGACGSILGYDDVGFHEDAGMHAPGAGGHDGGDEASDATGGDDGRADGDANAPGGGGGSGGAAGGEAGSATGVCAVLGAWQATEPFADVLHGSHPLPSFAAGSYYYVHTKTVAGADDRILYSARQGVDGSLGTWQVASPDHGGGPHGYTAIVLDGAPYHFRNGHIARYDLTAAGKVAGDVVLIEESVDTSFGGNRFVWDTAAMASFGSGAMCVLHLGGFSMKPYAYRTDIFRNTIPPGPQFQDTSMDHPAGRPGKAAFFLASGATAGYLFTGSSDGASLWRARVHADCTIDPFESMPDLPAGTGNERGDMFVVQHTLFVIRGTAVLAASVSNDGALSAWAAQPSLPEDPVDITWGDGHLEGASHGFIGDFVYVTGPKRVYYARVASGQPCW